MQRQNTKVRPPVRRGSLPPPIVLAVDAPAKIRTAWCNRVMAQTATSVRVSTNRPPRLRNNRSRLTIFRNDGQIGRRVSITPSERRANVLRYAARKQAWEPWHTGGKLELMGDPSTSSGLVCAVAQCFS